MVEQLLTKGKTGMIKGFKKKSGETFSARLAALQEINAVLMIIGSKKYDAIYSSQSIEKEDSLSIQTQIDIAKPFCTNEICYYSDLLRSHLIQHL